MRRAKRKIRTALGLAICAAPAAVILPFLPQAPGEGLATLAARNALLAASTMAASIVGIAIIATPDARSAKTMILRIILQGFRKRRAKALQAAIDCDEGIRPKASEQPLAIIASIGGANAGNAFGAELSEQTRAAIAHAFRGWTGRRMGPIRVAIRPLPESATLAAADLAQARRAFEALPNRAKGPCSGKVGSRES